MPFISSVRGSYGPQGRFGRARGIGAGSTGGTITTAGGYRIHTFLIGQSGTNFTADGAGVVEYLIVAGGGGGGNTIGGGAGAGGYRTGSANVTPQGYTITVGNFGTGTAGRSNGGNSGGNSSAFGITSTGGGGGGSYDVAAKNGGSGGGGA